MPLTNLGSTVLIIRETSDGGAITEIWHWDGSNPPPIDPRATLNLDKTDPEADFRQVDIHETKAELDSGFAAFTNLKYGGIG